MLEPGEIRICRACMRQIIDGNYTEIEQNSVQNNLYELIFCYIPEFEIEVENPCLCYECFSTLYLFHKFKKRCIRTEEDLRLYVREQPEVDVVDLNDVLTQSGDDGDVEVSITDVKEEVPLNQVTVLDLKDPLGDNWNCNLCGGLSFGSRIELCEHLAEAHNKNEETTCLICYLEFASKFEMERHLSVHTDAQNGGSANLKAEGLKHCTVCLNCFSDEAKLRARLREIQNINCGTVCLLCASEVKVSKMAAMHVLQSKGELTYKCHICEKSFIELPTFSYHMRILHPASEKRVCPHCTRVLGTNKQYEKHTQLHSQASANKFACTICKWVYFARAALETHLLSVHNVTKVANNL